MLNLHQLVIRSFMPDQDIPRLVSLYSSIEATCGEEHGFTGQELQENLISPAPKSHGDHWVVESPDDPAVIIGFAYSWLPPGAVYPQAEILVHRDWRRRGIGSELLTRMIERSVNKGSAGIEVYASNALAAAAAFLQKNDFTAQGAYTELRLAEGVRLPPVIWPFGYTMRPYSEVNDLSILTQVMNLSYIPLWGHREVSDEDLASWLPGFDKEGIFLVFSEKGRVVGISRAEPSTVRTEKNGVATGCIDAPGVVPQHRRLDLYRALVLTGIRWLHEHGQRVVEMESWGDKLEVLKMYRELGFTDLRQLVCYRLELAVKDRMEGPVSL